MNFSIDNRIASIDILFFFQLNLIFQLTRFTFSDWAFMFFNWFYAFFNWEIYFFNWRIFVQLTLLKKYPFNREFDFSIESLWDFKLIRPLGFFNWMLPRISSWIYFFELILFFSVEDFDLTTDWIFCHHAWIKIFQWWSHRSLVQLNFRFGLNGGMFNRVWSMVNLKVSDWIYCNFLVLILFFSVEVYFPRLNLFISTEFIPLIDFYFFQLDLISSIEFIHFNWIYFFSVESIFDWKLNIIFQLNWTFLQLNSFFSIECIFFNWN